MSETAESKYLDTVHNLLGAGREREALEAAELGFSAVGGVALARLCAELASKAGEVAKALTILQQALTQGLDLRCVRDMAVLQRDRELNVEAASESCRAG